MKRALAAGPARCACFSWPCSAFSSCPPAPACRVTPAAAPRRPPRRPRRASSSSTPTTSTARSTISPRWRPSSTPRGKAAPMSSSSPPATTSPATRSSTGTTRPASRCWTCSTAWASTSCALGNHEFDYGLETLRKFAARFPTVSANIEARPGAFPELQPWVVLNTKDGIKIVVFGLIQIEAGQRPALDPSRQGQGAAFQRTAGQSPGDEKAALLRPGPDRPDPHRLRTGSAPGRARCPSST